MCLCWFKLQHGRVTLLLYYFIDIFVQFCQRANEGGMAACVWGWEQKIAFINLLFYSVDAPLPFFFTLTVLEYTA